MNQSIIEWFKNGFFSYAEPFAYFSEEDKWTISEKDFDHLINQALEMEKERRQEDANYGYSQGYDDGVEGKEPMQPELK